MRKRGLQVVLVVWLFVMSGIADVAAQAPPPSPVFDVSKSFNWLVSRAQNGNYGDTMTTSLAAVALKNVGALSQANQALAVIKSTADTTNNCWPKSNCKPIDTAFAVWALDEFGEKTTASEGWLRSALAVALQNNWWLQIVTTENGTCTIAYPDAQGSPQQETIQVDAGKFPACAATPTKTFFDLNRCLKVKNIVVNSPSTTFDVDCRGLSPNTMISAIFNKGNEYTLVDQATAERSLITINNGCFGDSPKGSCVKDTSLYINWLSAEVESPLNTNAWLRTVYDNKKAFDTAMLFLASKTNDDLYSGDLVKIQRDDGSYDKDIRETAVAVLALKRGGFTDPANKAIAFLKSKQAADGSWESNTLKTALVLFAAFSDAQVNIGPLTGDGDGGGPAPTCGDNICDVGETELSCPKDCQQSQQTCVIDGVCQAQFGENSQNCANDCSCGDNICDSVEKASGLCTEDCGTSRGDITPEPAYCGNDIAEDDELCDGGDDAACPGSCQVDCTCEEKKSFGWLWTLLIILLLAAAAFFFIKHKKGGSNKKPFGSQKPEFRPYTSQLEMQQRQAPRMQYQMPPQQPVERSSRVDDELERSLREAKKLMKKI